MTATTRRNDEASRYEVLVGSTVAGSLSFYDYEGRVVLDLTRVDHDFAGQGLAGELVRAAMADVRARGLLIVPMCPYVSEWLRRHPEHEDLVDRALLAQIEGNA